MTQATLFDTQPPPKPHPLTLRDQAMQAAHDKATEAWRAAYTAHILAYLRQHGRATAEQIRLSYDGPEAEASQRASGAIFLRLRRDGRICEVGRVKSAIYGNYLVQYGMVKEEAK
jgi:hypothetical protein